MRIGFARPFCRRDDTVPLFRGRRQYLTAIRKALGGVAELPARDLTGAPP